MSSLQGSWECTFPGCDKRFSRKEHLNRHKLVHNPEHQYKCPICGRRYARSDVFRRHMKQHNSVIPRLADTRRICVPCNERNSQCDGGSPCGACVSNWTECHWVGSSDSHGVGAEPAAIIPANSNGQASWLPPTPEDWASGPLPAPTQGSLVTNGPSFGHEVDTTSEPAGFISASNMCQITSRRTSPSASHHPTTSRSPERTGMVDLHTSFDRSSPNTRRLVELFFTEIHEYWPLLHAPTFKIEEAPVVLLATLVILASWLEKGPDHQRLAPLVFDEVKQIRMESNPPLYILQAILFYIVYATCTLTADGMLAKALGLTGSLISTCRYLGIFNGQYTCHEMGDQQCGCPFIAWRIQEQLNRLAFSVLRADTYLSILLDHPPSVRYQELCIPLPKSSRLWAAASEPERRELQWNEPAGREKALFSSLMRDTLNPRRVGPLPYCLTNMDYHLSTCAMQTNLWELARQAHSAMSDELSREIDPGVFVELAHSHMSLWEECPVLQAYLAGRLSSSSGPGSDREEEHLLGPLSFTLIFVSMLKFYAPMNALRLRGHYYRSRPGTTIPTRKSRAHFFTWSSSGCPRSALWDAAQICRIFTLESRSASTSAGNNHAGGASAGAGGADNSKPDYHARLRLNPLLMPGVQMSAVLACSYARRLGVCADCRSNPHPAQPTPPPVPTPTTSTTSTTTSPSAQDAPIYLFDTGPRDPAFEAWKTRGEGVPYWGERGGERVPVCRCQLSAVAAWFRGVFAHDEAAEMELVLFLAELSAESKDGLVMAL